MSERPSLQVAVVMRRVAQDNRWQAFRWELADVVPDEPAFGTEALSAPIESFPPVPSQHFPGAKADVLMVGC